MMVKRQTDDKLSLTGIRRHAVGTTAAKRFRAQGLIPGVVYGKKTEAMAIAVNGTNMSSPASRSRSM